MGSLKKLLPVFFIAALMFSGCGIVYTPVQTEPPVRTVIQVDVTCRQEKNTLQRKYTAPDKMEAVLYYLRLLKPSGEADTDPERIEGSVYKIVLHFSDGQQRIYHQRADRYLSRDSHPWQLIDPAKATMLYTIIQQLPSDSA